MTEQSNRKKVADLTPEQKRLLLLEMKKRKLAQEEAETNRLAVSEEDIRAISTNYLIQTSYPADPVIDLIMARCLRSGNLPALATSNQTINFAQLGVRVTALASVLQEKGIQKGDHVAVLLPQTEELIISLLAVMYCGAVIVPLDLNFPVQRIKEIIRSANCKACISNSDLEIAIHLITPNQDTLAGFQQVAIAPEDPAYIIFTSGTTGTPKGAVLSHRAISCLSHWKIQYFEVTTTDKMLKFAGPAFDASIVEIYPALIAGIPIYLPEEEMRWSPELLNNFLEANQITLAFLPTQFCQLFMELDNNSLRHLYTGGEKLNTFMQRKYRMHNLYGPTENTVFTTCQEVKMQEENIPIGRPLPNVEVFLIDEQGRPLKHGNKAELCIGGDQLSDGYLNDDELNRTKFIPHPFKTGKKLYRTGDLCSIDSTGLIHYHGRLDFQIKFRGYRIELQEIEQRLLAHERIREACVIAIKEHDQVTAICAYLTRHDAVSEQEIRAHLALTLPEYMIPTHLVFLTQMPITANGKIDRKALPVPETKNHTGSQLPQTALQKQLAEIWATELQITEPGISDNFFELGGHSLKAIKINHAIQRIWNLELNPMTLFKYPTIAELANHLEHLTAQTQLKIEALPPAADYPVSNAQQRLWLMNQMGEGQAAFNIPYSLTVEGPLDLMRLEKAVNLVVRKHEGLRTYFAELNNQPRQVILDHLDIRLDVKDTPEFSDDTRRETWLKEQVNQSAEHVFNLAEAPLWHMYVWRESKTKHFLLMNFHHIISDGWSMNIFARDMLTAYRQLQSNPEFELTKPEIRYTDYAAWQEKQLLQDDAGENFWKNYLRGQLSPITFPESKTRPALKTTHGALYRFVFSRELTQHLKTLGKKLQVTDFVLLRSVFNFWMYQKTAETDLITGTPVAGRSNRQTEDIFGYFINTIPLRDQLNWNDTIAQSIEKINLSTRSALEYEWYPFEMILQKINYERDASRSPLFDTGFSWQNFEPIRQDEASSEISLSWLNPDYAFAKYDLWLFGEEKDGVFEFLLEYNTDLFDREIIATYSEELTDLAAKLPEMAEMKLIELRKNNEHQMDTPAIDDAGFDFNF